MVADQAGTGANLLGLIGALVPVAVAAGIGGLVSFLLTLPQQRRRISATATAEEARAASTLTGSALEMVSAAQADARAAHEEVDQVRQENNTLRREVRDCQMALDDMYRRERDLEAVLRDAGIDVPPRRRMYDTRPVPPREPDPDPEPD